MKLRFHLRRYRDGWTAESKIRYRRKKVLILSEGDTLDELIVDIGNALRTYFGDRRITVELVIDL